MASGSEVQLAVEAAKSLEAEGIGTRVVSVPCMEWFTQQSPEYIESVLPAEVRARVSVEAGLSMPWHRFVGDAGQCVSLEHFGASAPGPELFERFGFTADNVAAAGRASVAAVQR